MGDDGRRELPKPPRRVPGWATAMDSRTSLQPPLVHHEQAPRPPVPPAPARRRFRLLIPLLVLALVLGAGAGWLIRDQRRTLDPTEVSRIAGPSVVRVLATTCEGTGQATGVRLGDNLVLTTASAVRGPVSIGLETPGGQVRRAVVTGVSSADGIAVLRVIGRLDGSVAALASEEPDPEADRAILGYSAEGVQSLQPVGTANAAKPLAQIIGDTSLGAPVLDNHGRVFGLVTGETVGISKVIPLERLREYAGTQPQLAPEPLGRCGQARGPQAPQTPVLTSANTPLAGEALQTLSTYLNQLNRHDFVAMREMYAPDLLERIPLDGDRRQHRTSYVFGAKLSQVTPEGTGARAVMSYTALHWIDGPIPQPAGKGVTCSRWEISYLLMRVSGELRIAGTKPVADGAVPWRNCDS
jgi:hypothetical protein